ncbi:hypothetical protein DPMN_172541 [Dreissena polymorpha]|uniref:Uncharacterized protein n=1 Tax=Dreissena polymorpha TaxID=45954 RepID=A0A9D4IG63_DREPO|nr:hypothetical protein DPMN_172541 [Dreissena polymorpha]
MLCLNPKRDVQLICKVYGKNQTGNILAQAQTCFRSKHFWREIILRRSLNMSFVFTVCLRPRRWFHATRHTGNLAATAFLGVADIVQEDSKTATSKSTTRTIILASLLRKSGSYRMVNTVRTQD